jgi:predicted AlkP superfamily phosphohydrolase/phosphomutase
MLGGTIMEGFNKVVVIGLDGLNPDLVYQWKDELPTLSRFMDQGIYGKIKSTIPPITPQAWSCVLCGKNPGHFGFWDFTFRNEYCYGQPELVSSRVRDTRVDTIYKILAEHGKRAAIINVPVTYPPPEIPNGYSISSFLTPNIDKQFTYPASLKDEIQKMIGDYIIDASTSDMNFRQMNKEDVMKRIYDMDTQRFALTKYFIEAKILIKKERLYSDKDERGKRASFQDRSNPVGSFRIL